MARDGSGWLLLHPQHTAEAGGGGPPPPAPSQAWAAAMRAPSQAQLFSQSIVRQWSGARCSHGQRSGKGTRGGTFWILSSQQVLCVLGTKVDVEKGRIASSGLPVPALKLWVTVWMLIAIPSTLGMTSPSLTERSTSETVESEDLLCPSFQGLVILSRRRNSNFKKNY